MARTKWTGRKGVSQWGEVWTCDGELSLFCSEPLTNLVSTRRKFFQGIGGERDPTRPTRSPYHPFQGKVERTSFQARYAALPREIRAMVYDKVLDGIDTLYCIRLPQSTYDDKRQQPTLMSDWKPLAGLGPYGGRIREEFVEFIYEQRRFCIVDPHIGSLDAFLDTDIFFGTDVVPKNHIRNLTLELGNVYKPDREGNRWSSMLRNTNHRPTRYEKMRSLQGRLQRLLLSLSAVPESCTIKIWLSNDITPWSSANGVRALFLRFVAEAMMQEGLGKWRNTVVIERLPLNVPQRYREEWPDHAGGDWGGYLGRYGDQEIGWFEEFRDAMGM